MRYLKDVIKVKGFQVNPAEIEARLLEHPEVIDCCVVPVPHRYSGEVPKAYIVLAAEARERVLVSELQEKQLKDTLLQVCDVPLPLKDFYLLYSMHLSIESRISTSQEGSSSVIRFRRRLQENCSAESYECLRMAARSLVCLYRIENTCCTYRLPAEP